MCDKVQEIVDTFNLLSPENQSTLLKCACNTLEAENAAKESIACAPKLKEKISEESDTALIG